MANIEHRGADRTSKSAPRPGAAKAGRAPAVAGSRSFKPGRRVTDRARAAEAVADETAEARGPAVKATTQVVQTHPATGQEPMRSDPDAGVRTFEVLTPSWTRAQAGTPANPDLGEQAAPNVHGVSEASGVLSKGAQDAWRAWFELTQRSVRTNLQAMSHLANCRSAQQVIEVQSDLLRSNLQLVVESGEIIARASSDVLRRATQAQPQAAAAGRVS